MKQLFFSAIAVLVLALAPKSAEASNCSHEEYDHNGSLMEIAFCDREITISYINPRSGLRPVGVRDGTLLFEGRVLRNGRIRGQARIFSRRCGESLYTVEGTNQNNQIVLQGRAPKLDQSCRVVRHRPDTLLFTLQTFQPPVAQPQPPRPPAPQPPQTVMPTCPQGYDLIRGLCERRRPIARPQPPRPQPPIARPQPRPQPRPPVQQPASGQYIMYDLASDRAEIGYPKDTSCCWPGLWRQNIDAAVNWGNGKAYFFSGNQYVRYDINLDRADPGYPKQIDSANWPGLWTDGIDAVFNGGNGKALFFKGSQFIIYDIAADRADPGFPQSIENMAWPGLPPSGRIDSAINAGNGKAYFFSGSEYVRYDLNADKIDPGYPKPINGNTWPGLWRRGLDAAIAGPGRKAFFFGN